MGLKNDVTAKVKDYLSGDYEVQDTDGIPSAADVPFGKKAKRTKLCALSIDLRKSTDLLFIHQKQTAGKIHKAFLYTVAATVLDYGGYIRGFKGDSLLALWPAKYKSEITTCVRAAMAIKYLLTVPLAEEFAQYSEVDFGIGVDFGDVFIVRAGIPKNPDNNDLVFLGEAINFAVAIGEQAKGPGHVEISTDTYNNLEDNLRLVKEKDFLGFQNQKDIWRSGQVQWNGNSISTKLTTYHIEVS